MKLRRFIERTPINGIAYKIIDKYSELDLGNISRHQAQLKRDELQKKETSKHATWVIIE